MALPSPAVAWVVNSNFSGRSATVTVERSDHCLRDIGIAPVLEKLVPTVAGPGGASSEKRRNSRLWRAPPHSMWVRKFASRSKTASGLALENCDIRSCGKCCSMGPRLVSQVQRRINRLVDLLRMWSVDQVVLEGEERGARSCVDADLSVEVDHMRVHGGLRYMELASDLLVRQSTRDRPQYIHFSVRQTGRPHRARPSLLPRLTCCQPHCLNSSGVEAPSGYLILQQPRHTVWFERRPPSAIFAHRLVGLRDRQQAGGERQSVSGQPDVVAGAIEPLMMETRDGRGRTHRAGEAQDALGVIGMQANPLPLGLIERTAFDPHPIGHAHHAKVVNLRRSPYCDGVVRAQSCVQRRSLCESCNSR